MNADDWERAGGLLCPTCHREMVRQIDGNCPDCHNGIEAKRIARQEKVGVKRYVLRGLREGRIKLSALREGRY